MNTFHLLKSLDFLESLESLNLLESLESIDLLESLESLDLLESLESLDLQEIRKKYITEWLTTWNQEMLAHLKNKKVSKSVK